MAEAGGYESYRFIADLYDHVVPYRSRDDIRFYVDAAERAAGRVLEVGCGTGRVLIPIARAGREIVGLDLSTYMLDVCRERLEREPSDVRSRVRLVEADMRDFDLGETFGLVTVPFRPFQHLVAVDDQLACLASIHRHVSHRGVLILDLFNPSLERLAQPASGEEMGEEPEFTTPDGRRVVRTFRLTAHDRANQVNEIELIYQVTHADGRRERLVHAFPMRYLFRFEAEHLLARAGFEVEHVYADYDKSPFGSTYPGELIIVARRV